MYQYDTSDRFIPAQFISLNLGVSGHSRKNWVKRGFIESTNSRLHCIEDVIAWGLVEKLRSEFGLSQKNAIYCAKYYASAFCDCYHHPVNEASDDALSIKLSDSVTVTVDLYADCDEIVRKVLRAFPLCRLEFRHSFIGLGTAMDSEVITVELKESQPKIIRVA